MSEDADSVFAALRAGARGYLLKESDATDVHPPSRLSPAVKQSSVHVSPSRSSASSHRPVQYTLVHRRSRSSRPVSAKFSS